MYGAPSFFITQLEPVATSDDGYYRRS